MKLKLFLVVPTIWPLSLSAMEEGGPAQNFKITYNMYWIADTDAGDFDGGPPLHQAAAEGEVEKVKNLLENGCNVNTRNECGRVALHGAIRYGKHKVVDLLLTKSPNVNVQDYVRKQTPLHALAESGSKECFIDFLQRGGDVTIKDNWDHTPLVVAACFGNMPVIKAIIGYAPLSDLLLKNEEAANSKKRIFAFKCCLKRNKIEKVYTNKNLLAHIFSFLPDVVDNLSLREFINIHGCQESKCHIATARRIAQLKNLLTIVDKDHQYPWQFAEERNNKEIAELLKPETFSKNWYAYIYKILSDSEKTLINLCR